MMTAVYRSFAAPYVVGRPPIARTVWATSVENIDHTLLGVLLAVNRRSVALNVVGRFLRAGAFQTTLHENIYHAVLSMLLAVQPSLLPVDVEVWLFRTRVM